MRIICLMAVMLLAACSSQPPQTTTYLLRPAVATGAGTPLVDSGIGLGTVRVANYIDQPGLVLAAADGTIQAARSHVWAEPLQVSLRRYLATQISTGAGKDIAANAASSTKTRIDVMVDQLHGDGSGSAVLVAYWEVTANGDTAAFRFSESGALPVTGYDGLVRAEEALLSRLAAAIAGSLAAASVPAK